MEGHLLFLPLKYLRPSKCLSSSLSSFLSSSDGKESACNVGALGSIPGSGRSPVEENGYPLQYSCLENPMDRRAWWTTVHGVTKSLTWLRTNTFPSLSFSRLCSQGSSILPANPVLPSWGFISTLHPCLTFPFKAHTLDFLGVQQLRILLPMQGSWVPSLVWEDLTCQRATKPIHCKYWGHTP